MLLSNPPEDYLGGACPDEGLLDYGVLSTGAEAAGLLVFRKPKPLLSSVLGLFSTGFDCTPSFFSSSLLGYSFRLAVFSVLLYKVSDAD